MSQILKGVDMYDGEYQDKECPACGSYLAYTGTLGTLEWYCCEDCGIDVSVVLSHRREKSC